MSEVLEKKSVEIKREINNTVPLPATVQELSIDCANQAKFGELKVITPLETADINADLLPSWLADFVKVLAKQNNVPQGTVVMLAIAVLSAIIEKRFVIQPDESCQYFDLNLLSLIATDTTNSKSIIDSLIKTLTDIDRERAEKEISSLDRHKLVVSFWHKAATALIKQAVKTEVEARTEERKWGEVYKTEAKFNKAQSIVNEACAALEMKAKMPYSTTRNIINRVTEKRFPLTLAKNCGRMAIISDEGDLLKIMSSSSFLRAFNSKSLEIELDNKPVFYDNLSLTVGLVISPHVLEDLRDQSKSCVNKRELLAKSLLYVSIAKPNDCDLISKMLLPEIEQTAYVYGLDYLRTVHPAFTKDENTGSSLSGLIKLSNEARNLWLEFIASLESLSRKGGEFESMQDWIENLPLMVLRIAALLHLAFLVQKNIDFARSGDKEQLREALSPLSTLSPFNSANWEDNSKVSLETMQLVINLGSKLITHAEMFLANEI